MQYLKVITKKHMKRIQVENRTTTHWIDASCKIVNICKMHTQHLRAMLIVRNTNLLLLAVQRFLSNFIKDKNSRTPIM